MVKRGFCARKDAAQFGPLMARQHGDMRVGQFVGITASGNRTNNREYGGKTMVLETLTKGAARDGRLRPDALFTTVTSRNRIKTDVNTNRQALRRGT